ncbi:MAG: hypothetical protein CR971_02650 [candidate division SR1 bacterium]|nr:MAG: hypothetical protein CR971_02650 [candidate division SR1 bacterium]
MFFEKNIIIPHKKFKEEIAKEFAYRFPKTSRQSDFCLENYPFLYDIDKLLYDFDLVSSNEHTYNLNWAFLQTSSVLHDIFESVNNGVINAEITELKRNIQEEHCDEGVCKIRIHKLLTDIHNREKEQEQWIINRAKLFKFFSRLIMGIDIAISVTMITLISKYGHIGEGVFSSVFLVGMTFVLVVILKVFFDRFVVIPKVERFGRNIYKKFVLKIRKNLVDLVVIFLFLDWANKHYDPQEALKKLEFYWNNKK